MTSTSEENSSTATLKLLLLWRNIDEDKWKRLLHSVKDQGSALQIKKNKDCAREETFIGRG